MLLLALLQIPRCAQYTVTDDMICVSLCSEPRM